MEKKNSTKYCHNQKQMSPCAINELSMPRLLRNEHLHSKNRKKIVLATFDIM